MQNYSKAPFWKEYREAFEDLYRGCDEKYLFKVNLIFLKRIKEILEIDTKISYSMDFNLVEGRTERLVDLCLQASATEYISGPSARSYLEEHQFEEAQISVTYMDYSGYPEYDQLYPPFEHNVSVIDLIFNMGPASKNYMKSF